MSVEPSELNLKESLTFLKHSFSGFVNTKLELFVLEAKEVGGFALQKVVCVFLLALFSAITYLLFWLLVIGFSAILLDGSLGVISEHGGEWLLIVAFAFLMHIIGILLVVLLLKKKPSDVFFSSTKQELKRDKEWLAAQKK